MNSTWSLVLSILSNLLDTIVGDPVHAKQASATQKVLQLAAAKAQGSDVDLKPVADVLQAIQSTGRAPTHEDWADVHDTAHEALTGTAAANTVVTPRRSVQPAG